MSRSPPSRARDRRIYREGALALYHRSLEIREKRLDLLETLSEREALEYVRIGRKTLQSWLFLLDPADVEEGWSRALRWKGIATRQLHARRDRTDTPEGEALWERLRHTRGELARIAHGGQGRDSQVALTEEKESIERQLAEVSARWRGERREATAGPDEICAGLPAGTALVDFHRMGRRYLAFSCTADGAPSRVDLRRAKVIDEAISGWRETLGNPEETPKRVRDRGEVVWEAVWDPLVEASEPCDNAYLPLAGTADELAALERSWSRGRYRREPLTAFTGLDATETAVGESLGGHRVVHLATHGFFATETCIDAGIVAVNPMLRSGVVLAGANDSGSGDGRGVLTAEEVGSLDLQGTELVVLSACETGLGVNRSGGGILGLRRAFSAAGAGQLVMSLWSISDRDTADLMEAFYARFLHRRRPTSPQDALRGAQLEILERNRDRWGGTPRHLGGFCGHR